jgi:hypothetical protein
VTITAIQHSTIQIAPSHSVNDASFALKDAADRKFTVDLLSYDYNNSDRNRGQRAAGIVFKGDQFEGDMRVLKISSNTDILIEENKMNPNERSKISIRYIDDLVFFKAAQTFNSKVCWSKSSSCRNCPEGEMFRFGVRRGSGRYTYQRDGRTRADVRNINQEHRIINISAERIVRQHFPGAYKEIKKWLRQTAMRVPEFLGGENGLSLEMIVSHNLGNEAHVDQDVADKSVSLWTVGTGTTENPRGSYFVLSYLTCVVQEKLYKGIVVKLRHGCGIEWNGRSIFHSSTSPLNENEEINGFFFGVTRV